MTLKQLRIEKGLSQKECAEYLKMSTRNYQYYENDPSRADTAKYNAIIQKLKNYGATREAMPSRPSSPLFTGVVRGEGLAALTAKVAKYKKRECFSALKRFTKGDTDGRICILYGLRRTGKTTLLFQMIRELPPEKTAYIKIKSTDDMSMLTKDLDTLFNSGYRYVFIDEITLLEDFINTSAVLSDIFAMMGMKIVVSGTASLGFAVAGQDELYDRNVMIHTSFIPFREYASLLDIHSVDSYIEYGGTLKMENMVLDDPDAVLDEVSFLDDESTRKYIDTAISRNIRHTLKNDRFGEYFNQLRDLYDAGELTNVINRTVESMNRQFLLKVVEERFRSHDLGSARQLLLHELPKSRAHVLYDIDEEALLCRLRSAIDVKEKSETKIKVTEVHIEKIKRYLSMLDLTVNCTERYEAGGETSLTVFSQPGMRYSIAKALVFSLKQDEYFRSVSEKDKDYIVSKILEDVKGRMLEDIVLLETSKAAKRNEDVFKFKFENGGEYDMVIYDRNTDSCRLYEVKHSDRIVKGQTKHLENDDKTAAVERRYGRVTGKYVLYRGKNASVDGIEYQNVEEYLKSL